MSTLLVLPKFYRLYIIQLNSRKLPANLSKYANSNLTLYEDILRIIRVTIVEDFISLSDPLVRISLTYNNGIGIFSRNLSYMHYFSCLIFKLCSFQSTQSCNVNHWLTFDSYEHLISDCRSKKSHTFFSIYNTIITMEKLLVLIY